MDSANIKPLLDETLGGEIYRGEEANEETQSPFVALSTTYALTIFPLLFFLPHGGQWLYLDSLYRKKGEQDSTLVWHTYFYWISFIAFWLFRQTMLPWYISCGGGVVMDVQCLFKVQTSAYAFFYVMHIILLCFLIFHWMADLVVMYSLTLHATKRSEQQQQQQQQQVQLQQNSFLQHFRIFPGVVLVTTLFCGIYVAVKW